MSTAGPPASGTTTPQALAQDQLEAYVDAAADALGLPLSPDHRPGVLRYFALAADFAAQVQAVPLSPHDETAVCFVPITTSALPEHGL